MHDMVSASQRIVRERRQYNQWVASQTLEDYALRYTAAKARKSSFRVGNTALGPIAFLACEAIGGAMTISYGFPNTLWAIVVFVILMFLIGLPIAYYAAKYGVDIDLLTRGAGFGYLGSTLTSLIYASFTFLLFSVEASILSVALQLLLGIPLAVAHLCSALVVIPIAIFGVSLISRVQMATQPVWIGLQFLPIFYIAYKHPATIADWTHYAGAAGGGASINLPMLGGAASILLSLLPQIGEQVDYLRFLPATQRRQSSGWWTALIATGPGWVLVGGFKLLAGSFLTVLALNHGVATADASQPMRMYIVAFQDALGSPAMAVVLTGLFIIVCQLKINVTNAYAGSIAWSNFFSRLTHSHPGRVVWLVFNVLLALLLMEIGIFHAIDRILGLYANFAAGWIGALTADLIINKPLGLSPRYIEFRRAYLYDVNPVGAGALLLSVVTSSLSYLGEFGNTAEVLAPFIALFTAFCAAPLIAWATAGRYYLARPADDIAGKEQELRCTMCENIFERADMAFCPAYAGVICSLCCTLESRCHDACKPHGRVARQLSSFILKVLPKRLAAVLDTRGGHFAGIVLICNLLAGLLLSFIYNEIGHNSPARGVVETTLWLVYLSFLLLSGIGAWLIVLAQESRRAAEAESARQTAMLMEEIDAHGRTEIALQKAKETAEAANLAKTRYIVGISHEIRTPLNSISGYAQLLERGSAESADNAVRVIRRSSEHLSNLIDGLLDISRIENGMLRLNREVVQLGVFLDELVDMFRLQALAKGLDFRYDRSTALPAYVNADRKRLGQILINLLSNAIKYTETGHVSLAIRYRGQIAEFEVTDTGPGIELAERDKIFEPFERGTNHVVRGTPGTGLGLTITKLLAHIMGGDVRLQSSSPSGSTFVLRVLLSGVRDEIAAPSRTRRICDYLGPRQRILLADDDPLHLDLVQNLLRPLGFTVFIARDGKTCLDLAGQCQPDLAMIDISMPDISGWAVVKELRAAGQLPRLKIMMVSANAHDNASQIGVVHDAFVMKPVQLQQLLELTGTLLNLKWIYQPEPAEGKTGASVPAGGNELGSRSSHHLDDLYRLGRIGHVRGIEAKLRELELEDSSNEAFTAQMRALLANFDMKRYMSVLEAIRAD
jgi:signal transduction histidine kinase/CheY-like chemotaxis protein